MLPGSLRAGSWNSTDPESRRQSSPASQLLRHVRLWPLDTETTRLYGAVYLELRRQGRVLSQVDIMLAALARQHKLIVLTTDRDFEALADLAVENWAV
ncbi:MAG: type II toxin-antitoxin system VapC family toxin [Planctomycetaceae bacterium]|nr:type II toxin-antitoxin system VapC family toxin [Planctomycetaceae bacterium]